MDNIERRAWRKRAGVAVILSAGVTAATAANDEAAWQHVLTAVLAGVTLTLAGILITDRVRHGRV